MTGKDVVRIALDWRAQGRKLAVATVTRVWNTDQAVVDCAGDQLIVDTDGRFDGALFSGAVVGMVIVQARRIIESGKPEVLEFGITPDMGIAVELANAARIQIYVEPFMAV
jgi:xanthine dehydrogenase accessory factor